MCKSIRYSRHLSELKAVIIWISFQQEILLMFLNRTFQICTLLITNKITYSYVYIGVMLPNELKLCSTLQGLL